MDLFHIVLLVYPSALLQVENVSTVLQWLFPPWIVSSKNSLFGSDVKCPPTHTHVLKEGCRTFKKRNPVDSLQGTWECSLEGGWWISVPSNMCCLAIRRRTSSNIFSPSLPPFTSPETWRQCYSSITNRNLFKFKCTTEQSFFVR